MVVLHNIATYEGAGPTEARFTMHGNRSIRGLRYFEKLMHYGVCWCRAIHEK